MSDGARSPKSSGGGLDAQDWSPLADMYLERLRSQRAAAGPASGTRQKRAVPALQLQGSLDSSCGSTASSARISHGAGGGSDARHGLAGPTAAAARRRGGQPTDTGTAAAAVNSPSRRSANSAAGSGQSSARRLGTGTRGAPAGAPSGMWLDADIVSEGLNAQHRWLEAHSSLSSRRAAAAEVCANDVASGGGPPVIPLNLWPEDGNFGVDCFTVPGSNAQLLQQQLSASRKLASQLSQQAGHPLHHGMGAGSDGNILILGAANGGGGPCGPHRGGTGSPVALSARRPQLIRNPAALTLNEGSPPASPAQPSSPSWGAVDPWGAAALAANVYAASDASSAGSHAAMRPAAAAAAAAAAAVAAVAAAAPLSAMRSSASLAMDAKAGAASAQSVVGASSSVVETASPPLAAYPSSAAGSLELQAVPPVDRWVASYEAPPRSNSATVTYPGRASPVDLTEAMAAFRGTALGMTPAQRVDLAEAVVSGRTIASAWQTYQAFEAAKGPFGGFLPWGGGVIRDFVCAACQGMGVGPPDEWQLYQVYIKFDLVRHMMLPARDCLCLVDAICRALVSDAAAAGGNAAPTRDEATRRGPVEDPQPAAQEASASSAHVTDLSASEADRWLSIHGLPPACNGMPVVNYPGGVMVDFAEVAPWLAPISVLNAPHATRMTEAVESGELLRSALQTFKHLDHSFRGSLAWAGGEVQNFVVAVLASFGLVSPPSESQLYPLLKKFGAGAGSRLEVLQCLCLVDAVCRAAFCFGEAQQLSRSPQGQQLSRIPHVQHGAAQPPLPNVAHIDAHASPQALDAAGAGAQQAVSSSVSPRQHRGNVYAQASTSGPPLRGDSSSMGSLYGGGAHDPDHAFSADRQARDEPPHGPALRSHHPTALAEKWVANYAPLPMSGTVSITYSSGVVVDFAEYEQHFMPVAVANTRERNSMIQAIESGELMRLALKTFQVTDSRGYLFWDGNEITNYVTSVFVHYGLSAPTEAQVFPIFQKFDSGRSTKLNTSECLCLVDALFRAIFHIEVRSSEREGGDAAAPTTGGASSAEQGQGAAGHEQSPPRASEDTDRAAEAAGEEGGNRGAGDKRPSLVARLVQLKEAAAHLRHDHETLRRDGEEQRKSVEAKIGELQALMERAAVHWATSESKPCPSASEEHHEEPQLQDAMLRRVLEESSAWRAATAEAMDAAASTPSSPQALTAALQAERVQLEARLQAVRSAEEAARRGQAQDSAAVEAIVSALRSGPQAQQALLMEQAALGTQCCPPMPGADQQAPRLHRIDSAGVGCRQNSASSSVAGESASPLLDWYMAENGGAPADAGSRGLNGIADAASGANSKADQQLWFRNSLLPSAIGGDAALPLRQQGRLGCGSVAAPPQQWGAGARDASQPMQKDWFRNSLMPSVINGGMAMPEVPSPGRGGNALIPPQQLADGVRENQQAQQQWFRNSLMPSMINGGSQSQQLQGLGVGSALPSQWGGACASPQMLQNWSRNSLMPSSISGGSLPGQVHGFGGGAMPPEQWGCSGAFFADKSAFAESASGIISTRPASDDSQTEADAFLAGEGSGARRRVTVCSSENCYVEIASPSCASTASDNEGNMDRTGSASGLDQLASVVGPRRGASESPTQDAAVREAALQRHATVRASLRGGADPTDLAAALGQLPQAKRPNKCAGSGLDALARSADAANDVADAEAALQRHVSIRQSLRAGALDRAAIAAALNQTPARQPRGENSSRMQEQWYAVDGFSAIAGEVGADFDPGTTEAALRRQGHGRAGAVNMQQVSHHAAASGAGQGAASPRRQPAGGNFKRNSLIKDASGMRVEFKPLRERLSTLYSQPGDHNSDESASNDGASEASTIPQAEDGRHRPPQSPASAAGGRGPNQAKQVGYGASMAAANLDASARLAGGGSLRAQRAKQAEDGDGLSDDEDRGQAVVKQESEVWDGSV